MSDYISREALLALPTETKYDWTECIDIEDIKNFPAADVEPVRHGRWETFDSSYWRSTQYGVQAIDCLKIRCGLCGRGSAVRTNYCPNCGAKMDLMDLEVENHG